MVITNSRIGLWELFINCDKNEPQINIWLTAILVYLHSATTNREPETHNETNFVPFASDLALVAHYQNVGMQKDKNRQHHRN